MLRIAICDDLSSDRSVVEQYVKDYIDERQITAELHVYDHPDKMLKECETLRPQLYILDIVMPMVSGIEAARELRWDQKEAQIIFTTSEPSFALESFDVNPTNYILKPVDREKLFDSIDLALRHIDLAEEKAVTIKTKGGMSTVYVSDIMYIEYRNHTATYYLKTGEDLTTTTFRVGFKEYLANNHADGELIQCHESYAVNIGAINKLSKTDIITRDGSMVPLSKSRSKEVSEAYLNYRFN